MTPVPTPIAAPFRLHGIARLSLLALAGFSTFAFACVRDREKAPASSATPDAGSPPPVSNSPTPNTAPTVAEPLGQAPSGQPKSEPGTSTACNSDSDCRTFSDGCGICSCRPFAKSSPDPKCPGPRTTCLIDPCTGLRTICRKGNCMIGDPGDSAPPNVTTKDATSADEAGKRSDGAPPGAGSAAPKVADAATAGAASASPKVADAAHRD